MGKRKKIKRLEGELEELVSEVRRLRMRVHALETMEPVSVVVNPWIEPTTVFPQPQFPPYTITWGPAETVSAAGP